MNLNLARKWRSRNFDQIIGQQLSIRILKNSLYRNHFFPVYLFSGQRGCGKTTTARIFAAAVNCKELIPFQQSPKDSSIPCLACTSCQAMMHGRHPDFIEIDAASHTGVDNVRNIIEAASFLPLLGTKKIYLVDEAHMLSKAACNAFLKILEEPPTSVFFILATTDPQKIPDTVKSRCFQLLFNAVAADEVRDHLQAICNQESIPCDTEGLQTIVNHSGGSVRDAINLLEQVRFSTDCVTKQAVLAVIGYIDDHQMQKLLDILITKNTEDLVQWLHHNRIEEHTAITVWNSLLELIGSALWNSYGVSSKETVNPEHYSASELCSLLQMLYDYELLLLKTTSQHRLLENIFFIMCQQHQELPPSTIVKKTEVSVDRPSVASVKEEIKPQLIAKTSTVNQQWNLALNQIETLNDPLLASIFKQGRFVSFDEASGNLELHFAKDFSFFKERLDSTITLWKPLLQKIFGQRVQCNAHFIEEQKNIGSDAPDKKMETPMPVGQKNSTAKTVVDNFIAKKDHRKESGVNNSTSEKAAMLLKIFPGSITEIPKEHHE